MTTSNDDRQYGGTITLTLPQLDLIRQDVEKDLRHWGGINILEEREKLETLLGIYDDLADALELVLRPGVREYAIWTRDDLLKSVGENDHDPDWQEHATRLAGAYQVIVQASGRPEPVAV